MKVIATAVIGPYREALQKKEIPEKHPFAFIGKPLQKKQGIKKLFEQIKIENHER